MTTEITTLSASCIAIENEKDNLFHKKYCSMLEEHSKADMLTKVMIAYIYVLCSGTEFWKACELQGTRIIFKDFTIHGRLHANDLEVSIT